MHYVGPERCGEREISMEHILCKVYAAFSPVTTKELGEMEKAGESAIGSGDPWLLAEGDLLRISFEGAYFPLEEILEVLKGVLSAEATGKLDYLDMENWTLTRYVYAGGVFSHSERSLNHVMAYSGH